MIPLFGPSFISEDPELMNFLTAPEDRAVHNPFARNPLPNGWPKSGHEIWIAQGQLHKRSWTDGTEQLTESFPLPTLVSELEDGRRNYQRVSNVNAFL